MCKINIHIQVDPADCSHKGRTTTIKMINTFSCGQKTTQNTRTCGLTNWGFEETLAGELSNRLLAPGNFFCV